MERLRHRVRSGVLHKSLGLVWAAGDTTYMGLPSSSQENFSGLPHWEAAVEAMLCTT